MNLIRSVIFAVLQTVVTIFFSIVALFSFPFSAHARYRLITGYNRVVIWLAQSVLGIRYVVEGLEHLPRQPAIILAKHQSAWETFALMHLFRSPTFVMKRELLWIPVFGWLMMKGRMVGVDRAAGMRALIKLAAAARAELARGRQLIIFPEGTRRPVGAEPDYKSGIAFVYAQAGVPCLPVALNSGVFWPRRSILRRPGTVVVEILDAIPPGLDKKTFVTRLQGAIEPATARLVAEADVRA
jgi:1-acyl-sn-glycerol-3-phosphate acyltransferase